MRKIPAKARRADVNSTPKKTRTPSRASDESTIKATFYLTQEAIDGLEEAWLRLRRASDSAQRGAITKSLIVRLALEMALEEMTAKGTSSQLLKRIEQR